MQIGDDDVSFLSLVANTEFTPVPGLGNLTVDTPDFRLVLTALRELNLARTLAEPNLVALNGRSATFFAGDRVPLPAATVGFGAVGQSVVFDNVGVTLTFTPFIVERDRIRLQVAGRVSTLDDSQGQTDIGGSMVSAQNARSFQTTVDLRDGETMAMAGLILNTLRSQASRVPFIGDLPLVGTLFTDKGNAYSEQELVVLVTPELAHPLDACRTPPVPGADVFEPTDVEFYLRNRLESRRSQDFRSTVRTDHHRLRAGEKRFCDPCIIGPSGHSYGCCDHQCQIAFPAAGTVTPGRDPALAAPLESGSPPESDLAPAPAAAP
jgi:pilus assembly protein CpaC